MTNQVEPNPSMLGARIRPPDPKEIKYRLRIPALPDMTQVASVGPWMPPVDQDSQSFGSCTGQTVRKAMAALFSATLNRPGPMVDPYVIYYDARAKANWFGGSPGDDTGAYLADAFDVALAGVGRDDLWPTPSWVGEEPPAAVRGDAPNQDWLLGHQPMYASDPGGFLAGLWTAFQNRQPVGVAMAWYNRWFDHYEILPDNRGAHVGYHAICAYAAIPAGILHPEPLIVLRNSWGAYTDVSQLRTVIPEVQPGDVAVPGRYFTNGTVNEIRAATAEPIEITPDPGGDCQQAIFDERIANAETVRIRQQHQHEAERQYYEQGQWYEGDQCWYAGVQLGYAHDDILASGARTGITKELTPRPAPPSEPGSSRRRS